MQKLSTATNELPGRIVLSALLVLCIMLAACLVNPVTGKKEFSLLSERDELAMGATHYPVMTQISGGEFQDGDLSAYVNTVGQKLAGLSHRPKLPYQFNVVNSSEVNAYALPGGKISITRGLISRMENEAQLAAVLAHEVGHVTARHVSEVITRQILAQATVAGLSIYLERENVKNAQYYSIAGLVGAQLMMLKFSRDNERQADELGMDYMVKAGYDPQGMVQLQEILLAAHSREQHRLEAFFQTHPLTRERIETARSRIAEMLPSPGVTLAGQRFRENTTNLRQVAEAYKQYDQGVALLAEGKTQQAIRSFEAAISRNPAQAVFHSDLGGAHLRLKQYGKARLALNQALQLYPGLFQSRFLSGMHTSSIGSWNRSLKEFDQCNGLIPDHPGVRYHQGLCHERLGHRQQAIAHYRAAISLQPEGQYADQSRQQLRGLGVTQ